MRKRCRPRYDEDVLTRSRVRPLRGVRKASLAWQVLRFGWNRNAVHAQRHRTSDVGPFRSKAPPARKARGVSSPSSKDAQSELTRWKAPKSQDQPKLERVNNYSTSSKFKQRELPWTRDAPHRDLDERYAPETRPPHGSLTG